MKPLKIPLREQFGFINSTLLQLFDLQLRNYKQKRVSTEKVTVRDLKPNNQHKKEKLCLYNFIFK